MVLTSIGGAKPDDDTRTTWIGYIPMYYDYHFKGQNNIVFRSKPIEAFFGVVSVFMALVSSFGLLFFLGSAINPIGVVTPFLVLSIGTQL